jgi:hypothetical protein
VSTITRTWLAFAAIGAGLVHLALVISSPVPIAIALVLIGVAEFGWGVLALARERVAAPRLVLFFALVPMLLWGLTVASATLFEDPGISSSLGFGALAAATVLELFIAITLAVQLRRGVDFAAAPKTPPAGRYILALVVGGILVGAITTPALAATDAGRNAHHHGTDTLVIDPHSGH